MAEKKETDTKAIENKEWLDSLKWVIDHESEERASELLDLLLQHARTRGIAPPALQTPYINTIAPDQEDEYPGDLDLEEKITGMIRWNAMAMVMKANQKEKGIGGHISTYASAANLFEVGFNHFFRVDEAGLSDMVYFQGHASPGVYARAYVEGRFDDQMLENFRRELLPEGGLTSYPHPRLMPEFWTYPTVSMGLGPIMAIYQARFNKYLCKRGLKDHDAKKIWAFLGDGEMDEPEATGAIALAGREKLGNLIFVVNCNLQRLDGPVRGNTKVVQELEGLFRGAGWNVVKVLWASEWDKLFQKDTSGKLIKHLTEVPDGQLQKYAYEDGTYIREHLFGQDPELQKLAENLTDEDIKAMRRGGHDPIKVYQAYKQAMKYTEGPTVILAQTVKGYGQGESGEASNVTHKTKKLKDDALKQFRDRFQVPLADEDLDDLPFVRPEKDSAEHQYLMKKREEAGGAFPVRKDNSEKLPEPDNSVFEDLLQGSGDSEANTTGAMVQIVTKLLKQEDFADLIVPIIPDESRTFGMESLFRKVGIYAPHGQQYEPVDKDSLLYYKESEEGAILEEGITESGCMSSFIAAGTAYLTHGINTIPFYFFYSMFGFQRTGDLIWAAADAGAKGFLIGGISGRTSLSGEGLQHQDGNSHLYAMAYPNLHAYDPAFAFELAVIVREGIKKMYIQKQDTFYYLTVTNANRPMPEMPEGVEEGILKGLYRYRATSSENKKRRAHLFGSGAIMQEVQKAAHVLEEEYGVATDVWSITSYKALYDDAIDAERENRRVMAREMEPNHIQKCLQDEEGVFVAASDYVKALPASVAQWFPNHLTVLGTDGFGRSDTVAALRDFFEVDHRHIIYATLYALTRNGDMEPEELVKAADNLDMAPDKPNPRTA
ncbi:pyruvate dehydrogenase (acetyl-transferring), homodimeric type [Roseivirga sp. BDSF3-8]|uniref:pyruvate dehydrogenase (acetyl-transferring), homodimeric type n=1 Tax=Roseivirga sp. BDSF3-8 TaxID=3241598 RepID=UPI003531F712